jgi:hypothetical protein
MTAADLERPPLRLIRGDASPEELAALVAVLSAATAAETGEARPRHTSRWSSPHRAVRQPLTPGPGAWRASGWPS